jgi:hypothetical protein
MQANFNGHSAIDMIFNFIGRVFTIAKDLNDEIIAMCSITILISILENINGIESYLHNIIGFLV